jgi:antirestriction protein ArdC
MFVDQFADKIVDALEKGNAPWQKEWKAGEIVAPYNPATGKRYSGVNLVTLAARQMETGSADPRYMTARQARDNGSQIREGAKGVAIQYWQVHQKGRPLACIATVFHASEIDGMSPLSAEMKPAGTFSEAQAESMLRNAKVNIAHEDTERCSYRPGDDTIYMPPKERFQDAREYYATALSGLTLASGHPERMNRPFSPKGSEASASEQLRTEIARWMLSADMGLPFEPGRQDNVGLWVESVKKDPHEIVRACRDAEKIVAFIKDLEHGRELPADRKAEYQAAPEGLESARDDRPSVSAESGQQGEPEEKTWLNVPYTQRYLAKDAGAKWDGEAKLWYAPAGSDLKAFERWMPDNALTAEKAALSPQEEFARALQDAGLDLKGQMPLMDGQIHRVPLLDSRSGKLNGSYKAFLDGIPAGFIENWKTGEKSKWKYSGHMLSGAQIHRLRLDAATKREAEAKEMDDRHNSAAKRCFAIWKNCDWASKDHPYLSQKQVGGFGVKVDAQGNLIVPGRNASGAIRTILTITPKNLKKFEPGAEVKGTFHVIDPGKRLENKKIADSDRGRLRHGGKYSHEYW